MSDLEFDPYSPKLHANPYPVYRRLRDEHPVFHQTVLDFWALSRYADVAEALHHPEVYCSSQGISVGTGTGVPVDIPMLIMLDPPRHTQLRALVNRAFTPRRIAALEPRIREIARGLIGAFADREDVDLVADYSAPLPTIVIAELLGVPAEDQQWFKERSTAVAQFEPADAQGNVDMSAMAELGRYLSEVIDQRRRAPRDDLISALVAAEIDGESLGQNELIGFSFLLLVAGNETTTNLISNAAVLLAQHPDQREKLVANPGTIPTAVEEFLRFESPIQGLARTLTRDVELHGVRIHEGEKVLLLFASANRDERRLPDAARFDVGRDPNPHLAFGFGTHFCLGASLARLESRIAFEELLAAAPRYEMKSSEVARLNSGPIRGVLELPLALNRS